MTYLVIKLVHLVALLLWIGPPLGMYVLLFRAHATRATEQVLWLERESERVLVLEHVAFVVLLLTGAALVFQMGPAALSIPWLQKKLVCVAAIVVFEGFDIWLAHVVTHRILNGADAIVDLRDPRFARVRSLRRVLAMCALPIVILCIPGAFYFAVTKS